MRPFGLTAKVSNRWPPSVSSAWGGEKLLPPSVERAVKTMPIISLSGLRGIADEKRPVRQRDDFWARIAMGVDHALGDCRDGRGGRKLFPPSRETAA